MRKRIVVGLSVLATAFVGYVAFNAWIAFVPPKRPVSSYTYAPECERLPTRGNAYVGSPMECQARIYEAQRLKQHAGLAVRNGNNLTLFYNGKQSARLVAKPVRLVDTPDCDSYAVHKILPVHDTVSGKTVDIAQISCHRGEFEERFVSMPDGSRWIVGDASSPPGGKHVVLGQNRPDFGGVDSKLTIVSWPDRKVEARFTPRCRVLEWQAEEHFTVTCIANFFPGNDTNKSLIEAEHTWLVAFDAKVWRDGKGRWRMQATRWLQPMWEYNNAGDLEYPPTFSLLPLPRFTAEHPSPMAF
jgi:hypothetical protein